MIDPRQLFSAGALLLLTSLLALVLLLGQGCASGPVLELDTGKLLTVDGSLRCEGEGVLRVLDSVDITAEGLAAAEGDIDAAGEGGGDACAGVVFSVLGWRYELVSAVQDEGPCYREPGLYVEQVARE